MAELVGCLLDAGKRFGVKTCEFITTYDPKLAEICRRKGFVPTQIIYSKEV